MAFFKVTYAEESRTAHVYNRGCNFGCGGCYYKLKPGLHKDGDDLSPVQIKEALLRLHGRVQKVNFLGGEPTIVAHELEELAGFSHEMLNASTHLLTNGSNPIPPAIDAAEVSIKAPSNEKYLEYTGRDKYDDVLRNVAAAHRAGVELRLTSVLVPGFVDAEEIEKIAVQLAKIDPDLPFHIKGYVAVPGAEWRRATKKEVEHAVQLAGKHLRNVTGHRPDPDGFEYRAVRIL